MEMYLNIPSDASYYFLLLLTLRQSIQLMTDNCMWIFLLQNEKENNKSYLKYQQMIHRDKTSLENVFMWKQATGSRQWNAPKTQRKFGKQWRWHLP